MFEVFAHGGIKDSAYLNSPEASVSWLGIALAVVTAMVIGFIWYGPLFGKKWMKLVKLDPKKIGNPAIPTLIMLGLAIIQAFILAHFIVFVGYFYPDYSELSVGLLTATWAVVGFILPVLVSNTVFSKGSMELLKINLGNQIVTLLAIGAILGTVN